MGLGFLKVKKNKRENREREKKYTTKWRKLWNIEKKRKEKRIMKKWYVARSVEVNSGLERFSGQHDLDLQDITTWPVIGTCPCMSFPTRWTGMAAYGPSDILKTSCGLFLLLHICSSHCHLNYSPTPHLILVLTHTDTHTTRNWVIISNSLLSTSYAQQLLNFVSNFQKILSVSTSEIACPDAP